MGRGGDRTSGVSHVSNRRVRLPQAQRKQWTRETQLGQRSREEKAYMENDQEGAVLQRKQRRKRR